METFDDQYKNLYVIKRKLSELKANKYGQFDYRIGDRFFVKIFAHRIQDSPNLDPNDRITLYKEVDVILDERVNKLEPNGIILTNRINLAKDPRFKDYQPIKYGNFSFTGLSSSGYNGDLMPIEKLCELIKYLHRLDDLKAFA